jgi:flavin reductase (DIM6/NTAB) family NADH-FMN oxidoreductase RutF
VPFVSTPGATDDASANIEWNLEEQSLSTAPTGKELRRIFGSFATGVTVVTAIHPDGRPVGVTANSFTSVSLNPPLLLFCLANSSTSLDAFAVGAPFAVNVLNAGQTDQALHFSRSNPNKIEPDSDWQAAPHPPAIPGALARMDCVVVRIEQAGDHRVVYGAVQAAQAGAGEPLLFFRGRFGVLDSPEIWRDDPQDAWSNTRPYRPRDPV